MARRVKPPSGGRGGRFAEGMDPAAAALNARRISTGGCCATTSRDPGARPHAGGARLIVGGRRRAIVAGLDRVADDSSRGARQLDPALEDVHMNVEARLTELIGEAGAAPAHRAQPQRSGRDRPAALRAAPARRAGRRRSTRRGARCAAQAREHVDTLLPGYTHLQRAQPVRARAPPARLRRDARARSRPPRSTRRGAPTSRRSARARWPATTLPIDRERRRRRARLRGRRPRNSLDAVGDRDFAVELVARAR